MASEWQTLKLGEVARFRKGVSYSGRYLDQPGPRLLGLGTVQPGGGLLLDKARTYSGPVKGHQRVSGGEMFVALTDLTQEGKVLGSPALLPPNMCGEFVITHHVARVELNEAAVDTRFLYYAFRSAEFRAHMRGVATGTTVRAVSPSDAEMLEVSLPPLQEQRAIAHALGTLDDKIELNRRMSETLENMARALFKSWFVDFDPVRAKMKARDRCLPGHLSDYFPDQLVASELGDLPEGWQTTTIGALADVLGGSTPSTKRAQYWEGGVHNWVTPKDLSPLVNAVLLGAERKITEAGLKRISSGLLPVGTVLLSSRAPIGYLAITEVQTAINQGFIAMKPRPGVSNLFLLRWAESAQDLIKSRANGSTFLEISKSSFRPIRVVAPPSPVMNAFDRLTRPMYERVVQTERESRTLATLRDTLLPKLISGELRVP